jgi:bifunctional DNA-binding transcriptional regulator/antitoxin component of YhaV-PrlF toxin-antitoxin module
MVELKTKMTGSGMVYIPKEVRESFGAALRIIPDARAAVVFPEGTHYQDVLDSLDIIASDIRHRLRLAQRKTGNE